MVVGSLGNKSPDSNRFTLVTPKPENGVRLQATLGNQNPTGLPVGVVRNFKLASIKKGDLVKVTHYQKTHYVETNGIVSEINEVDKYLRIVVMKIAFSDIVNIDIISSEDL